MLTSLAASRSEALRLIYAGSVYIEGKQITRASLNLTDGDYLIRVQGRGIADIHIEEKD